jgi:hypothetical protein
MFQELIGWACPWHSMEKRTQFHLESENDRHIMVKAAMPIQKYRNTEIRIRVAANQKIYNLTVTAILCRTLAPFLVVLPQT